MLPVSTASIRFVVGAIIACAICPTTWAAGATLSPDLAAAMAAQPGARQRVIVQTVTRPSSALGLLPARLGGRLITVFSRFNGYVAELPSASVRRLAAMQGVKHISRDLPVAATFRKLPPGGYAGPWDESARSVGADAAWNGRLGSTGSGVSVAVLDSGVSPNRDFRLAGFVDLVNHQTAAYDDNGHGTHVAGIIAGSGESCGGRNGHFLGEAPEAGIVGVKVLNADSSGLASVVIQGIDWCIANRDVYRIGVINLSLGHPIRESATTDPLCLACERAVTAGIVVVVAAGNYGDGYGGITSPGNDPSVITVGAMKTSGTPVRSDDAITTYSSRGPTCIDYYAKPDLLAPGNRVVSTRAAGSWLDTLFPGNRVAPWVYGGSPAQGANYFVLSGTSMAAPVVAGAAALILSQRPGITPNAVKVALMLTAQPVGGYDPVLAETVKRYDWMTQGAGYLNVIGALRVADTLQDATAPNPGETVPSDWGQDVIQGESVLWGNAVLWGNRVVDADDFAGFLKISWDRSVLWGDVYAWTDGFDADDDAVSTTSVLWGNHPLRKVEASKVLTSGE